MDISFILNRIEETSSDIIIYIESPSEEDKFINYIKDAYVEVNKMKFKIGRVEFEGIQWKISIDKEKISDISNAHREKVLKLQVRLELYPDEFYIDVILRKGEGPFKIWNNTQEDITLLDHEKGLLFISTENVLTYIMQNRPSIYGEYECVDSSKGKIRIDNNFLDRLEHVNYTCILVNRKNKNRIELYRFNQESRNLFEIDYSKIITIAEEANIWDVYIDINIDGQRNYQIRVATELNIEIPKIVIGYNNKIIQLRPYRTADGYISFILYELKLIGKIDSLDWEENRLGIQGYVCIPNYNEQLCIENVKIKDSMGKVLPIENDMQITYAIGKCNFSFKLDFGNLINEKNIEGIYNIYITLDIYGQKEVFKLEFNEDRINKEGCMIYPKQVLKNLNYKMVVQPKYNKMALVIEIYNLFNTYFLSYKRDKSSIKIACKWDSELKKQIGYKDIEVVLINQSSKKETILKDIECCENQLIYTISSEVIGEMDRGCIYSTFIKMKGTNFCLLKEVIFENNSYETGKRTVCNSLYESISKGHILLYYQDRGRFILRKEGILSNGKIQKLKDRAARSIAKLIRPLIKRKVWLIGENLGQIAQDNGFAFFEYCIKNHKAEKIYYVARKDNKDIKNLSLYQSHVLEYDSFKHLINYHLAEYLIVSHGIRDVIPSIFHNKINTNNKDIIYLQHGITAMKKIFFNKDSYNGKIRKFVVCSEQEKNIFINYMGFKAENIMITGFSRFDKLINNNKNKRKEIILMPTWRDWSLNNEEEFLNSDFYLKYNSLLKNKRLHRLLEENNIYLKFYPHIEIQKKYIHLFTDINSHIEIVNIGQETVQDLIRNSMLMITDYSSVALDFNYLEKPVLFYQFDLNEYLFHRGSFINLESDLIGDRYIEEKDLIDGLERYINNNFKYNEIYKAVSDKFYNYRDLKNSERIYNEIKKIK